MAGQLREHHPLSHSPDRSPATARRIGPWWGGGCGSSFGVGMHVSEAVQEQLKVDQYSEGGTGHGSECDQGP